MNAINSLHENKKLRDIERFWGTSQWINFIKWSLKKTDEELINLIYEYRRERFKN